MEPKLCQIGFHFSRTPLLCSDYRRLGPSCKCASVIAIGKVVEDEGKHKCVTDELLVEKEIPFEEFADACTGEYTDENGDVCTRLKGNRHSFDDKPAKISRDGST